MVVLKNDLPNLEEKPAPTTGETSAPPTPKTAKQLAARRNQERVKSILLLAILDEYLLNTNGVSTASTNLVLPVLVNTARRKINTADGQSRCLGDKDA
ncbi:hypothetical protein Tco_1115451 [Tanacetum coccineum]